MSGKDTQDLITEIYGDSGADLDEMTQLRARVDQAHAEASEQEGADSDVEVICKAFDLTRMLVEQGIWKTRHRGRDPVDPQLLSIVAANVAYLQATTSAFSNEAPQ